MACGVCNKNRQGDPNRIYDVLGGYKYLPDSQIKARLEVFKKRYCANCPKRYDCTYDIYFICEIRPR